MSRYPGISLFTLAAATIALSCATTSAFADEHPLGSDATQIVVITSAAFPGRTLYLGVLTDVQGDLKAIRYTENPQNTDDFPLSDQGNDIVLYHAVGVDVITLSTEPGFTAQHGGLMRLNYVYNVLRPGNQGYFMVDLVRDGARWLTYEVKETRTPQGKIEQIRADQPFTHMDLVPHRFIHKIVGIGWVNTW